MTKYFYSKNILQSCTRWQVVMEFYFCISFLFSINEEVTRGFLVMALVRGYVQPESDAEHELIVQAASSVVILCDKSKPEVV